MAKASTWKQVPAERYQYLLVILVVVSFLGIFSRYIQSGAFDC